MAKSRSRRRQGQARPSRPSGDQAASDPGRAAAKAVDAPLDKLRTVGMESPWVHGALPDLAPAGSRQKLLFLLALLAMAAWIGFLTWLALHG